MMIEFYDWLSNIDHQNYGNKSVLIIGGSEMGKHYCQALLKLKVEDITVITQTSDMSKIIGDSKIKSLKGGFEKNLPNIDRKDLVIVATPIPTILEITELAIRNGQNNILVEKPGSLYPEKLLSFNEKINSQEIIVAYNRLVYPNFHLLKQLVEKEGGITSCRFTFTEWLNRIDFKKDLPEVYTRWGISNSLHVISMAMDLIGMPKEIDVYQSCKLDWHPSGSIFVGSGITEKNIPFSYHADWNSGGRWGIEIMTPKNAYQLVPLEQLNVSPKYTAKWKSVPFKMSFHDIKQGIAEEVAVMLERIVKEKIGLVTLKKAAEFNKLAETIFGYHNLET